MDDNAVPDGARCNRRPTLSDVGLGEIGDFKLEVLNRRPVCASDTSCCGAAMKEDKD